METPDRYWSGLYWDGFDPAQIGAFELSDASSDDATVDKILHECRRRVTEVDKEQSDDYLVSIVEMEPEAAEESENHTENATKDASSESGASSAASSSSATATSASSDKCDGRCLVIRLWHADVFLGARETAKGDPGARCRDLHFHSQSGQFLHQMTLAETDAILDGKQQR